MNVDVKVVNCVLKLVVVIVFGWVTVSDNRRLVQGNLLQM